MPQSLTDRTVKALKTPDKKYQITYDNLIPGFGVRTTSTGAKSFILNYAVNGRERRFTLGKYPAWSVAAARNEAGRLRQLIDTGRDPMAERNANRTEPTVRDLCDRYLKDHAKTKKRASSLKGDKSSIQRFIKPQLGGLKISAVSFTDIDRLHQKISKATPIQANRVVALLSKMFTLSIRWQYRTSNPVQGIERNQENRRKTYLKGDQMCRLTQALSDYPYIQKVRVSRAESLETGQKWKTIRRDKPLKQREQSCNVIRLLILTGARKGETLAARWDQIDFDAGTWTKPGATTKQKTDHTVPLSAPALALLSKMPRNGDYVFPGRDGGPQTDVKNTWASIQKMADIKNIRIHDLRHSYASQLASAGLSLPIIGALLGHTQAQTTQRYSHLFDEPLRKATETVGAAYEHAETGNTAEVINIRGEK